MNKRILKNTIFLSLSLIMTRILGFVIKIISSRILGKNGINLLSLIMPTYQLLITITSLSIPLSISILLSKKNKRSKRIFISILPIIFTLNIFTIIITLNLSKFISINLLQNKYAIYPIKMMALVLPFISISSILRGYFYGKANMKPDMLSNIIEQIIRLILIVLVLPIFMSKNYIYGVCSFLAFNIIEEIVQIIIFTLYLPNYSIKKEDLVVYKDDIKDVMNISIPNTGKRLIGSLNHFLEPILLSNTLSKNYKKSYIIDEYGSYAGYTMPILMIPSILTQALSTSLIPEISHLWMIKDYKNIKSKLKKSLISILMINLITSTMIFIYSKDILYILFKTTSGYNYLRVLTYFFILYNLDSIISSILITIGYSNKTLLISLISSLLEIVFIVMLGMLHIGIYNLVIGEIVNITVSFILSLITLKKILH